MRRRTLELIALLAAGALLAASWSPSLAQTSSKSKTKTKGGSKSLDARVEKLESTMLREIVDISNEYEAAGQHARAKGLLEVLLKLNPNFPGLKEKVEQLNEKVFDSEEIEVTFDTAKTWTSVPAMAVKGKMVRVEVEGEYRFEYSADLSADGIATVEAGQEYNDGIPCGGLMAVTVNDGKPSKPTHLKSKMQWSPTEDGIVMLKINAPVGHKSTGKLTVRLSGLVRPN